MVSAIHTSFVFSPCQIKFFDFYGRKLNNWDVGISCNSARTFFLKSDNE
jgi:hypothetical protein